MLSEQTNTTLISTSESPRVTLITLLEEPNRLPSMYVSSCLCRAEPEPGG